LKWKNCKMKWNAGKLGEDGVRWWRWGSRKLARRRGDRIKRDERVTKQKKLEIMYGEWL